MNREAGECEFTSFLWQRAYNTLLERGLSRDEAAAGAQAVVDQCERRRALFDSGVYSIDGGEYVEECA